MNIGDFVESDEGFYFIGKGNVPNTITYKKGFNIIKGKNVAVLTKSTDLQERQNYKIGGIFTDVDKYVIFNFPGDDKIQGKNIVDSSILLLPISYLK